MRELNTFESTSVGGGRFMASVADLASSVGTAAWDTAGLIGRGCLQGAAGFGALGATAGFIGTIWSGPGSLGGAGAGGILGAAVGCPVGGAAAVGGALVGTIVGSSGGGG